MDKRKDSKLSGDDSFEAALYTTINSDIEAALQVKGHSSEEFVVCNDLILALPNMINAISDGAAVAPKQSGGWEVQVLVQKLNLTRI